MTEAKNIISALAEMARIEVRTDMGGQPYALVPEDYQAIVLEEYMDAPIRIRQSVNLKTSGAFIDYVKRFKDGDTTIFADKDERALRAVLDYHISNPDNMHVASWSTHKANYACPLSRGWKAWIGSNGEKFNQLQFAEFLEERAKDIVKPSGAELLDIALKFNVTRKSVFGSAIRLNSGEVQFQFSDQNEKKASVEVPEEFTIGVAPFHNGDKYELKARLRYRINEGKLTIWYQLIEPEQIIEDAFKGVCQEIAGALPELQMLEAELPR